MTADPTPHSTPDHPTPNAPNPAVPQHYACERPEDPTTGNTLWHASCAGCRLALEAAMRANPGLVLCTHGASYEGFEWEGCNVGAV